MYVTSWDFPGGLVGKEYSCNAEDPGLIPGLGRSPGEKKGYSLQYSCLENSMHRGAWWVHGACPFEEMFLFPQMPLMLA